MSLYFLREIRTKVGSEIIQEKLQIFRLILTLKKLLNHLDWCLNRKVKEKWKISYIDWLKARNSLPEPMLCSSLAVVQPSSTKCPFSMSHYRVRPTRQGRLGLRPCHTPPFPTADRRKTPHVRPQDHEMSLFCTHLILTLNFRNVSWIMPQNYLFSFVLCFIGF